MTTVGKHKQVQMAAAVRPSFVCLGMSFVELGLGESRNWDQRDYAIEPSGVRGNPDM